MKKEIEPSHFIGMVTRERKRERKRVSAPKIEIKREEQKPS